VYIEIQKTKKEALIKEKAIKKYSTSQIEFLLESEKNIIGKP
jgi:predicted GIY-YIG superfamily endonuclease